MCLYEPYESNSGAPVTLSEGIRFQIMKLVFAPSLMRVVCGALINLCVVPIFGQQLTSMHSFSGRDGSSPAGTLVLSSNSLYGTTSHGGTAGKGTIFVMKSDGTSFSNLHNFSGGDDGAYPSGSLCVYSNILYGTAPSGGASNNGTLFRLNADGSAFATLHTFTGLSDGSSPTEELVSAGDVLYGMANGGGTAGTGLIFKINADGSGFTAVHNFDPALGFPPTNGGGVGPRGGLVLSGSTLYGTSFYGGSSAWGTVFKVNTDGTGFALLHNFDGNDGANPMATLLLEGGSLYGTTSRGGAWGSGTIFKVNLDGTAFFTLFHLDSLGRALSAPYTYWNFDGAAPAKLVSSGNALFGTGTQGGFWGIGNVFQFGLNGTGFKVLHDFTLPPAVDFSTTNIDGETPNGVILSGNILYGTTASGGNYGSGTVFSFALSSPKLTATRSGSSLILTWNSSTTGWKVISSSNPYSRSWDPVVPVPVTVNGESTVTNIITGTQRFYRLTQ